jgi:GH24 family phage-related lysozyme (muramidase)
VPIHADHKLVKLIEGFEGGQSRDGMFHPYWDKIGQCWTIGFGHTEHVTSHTHALTKAEAEDLLLHDLNHAYSPAVDLAYNCGVGILSPLHTIGQSLRAHNIKKAGEDLMLYVHGANGVVVQGLVNRRKADQKLYNSK